MALHLNLVYMKPSEIIKLARRQTGCTEDIVTTDEAYRFLNFVIEDFWADIRASDSWHWFDYLNIDVNAWSPTYSIDENAWEWYNKFPISKLEKVWYRMPDWKWRDLDIRFIDKIDVNDFADEWEPRICFLCNNTLNLMPAPKTDTTMQIWGYDYNWELSGDISIEATFSSWPVQYWRNPDADDAWKTYPYAWHHSEGGSNWYTSSEKPAVWDEIWELPTWWLDHYPITSVIIYDEEENIWIPKRWHYILVEWLKYWMYWNMWVNFETARANSRAFYDNEKMKALQNIMDRWQESDEPYFPDLYFLNY